MVCLASFTRVITNLDVPKGDILVDVLVFVLEPRCRRLVPAFVRILVIAGVAPRTFADVNASMFRLWKHGRHGDEQPA